MRQPQGPLIKQSNIDLAYINKRIATLGVILAEAETALSHLLHDLWETWEYDLRIEGMTNEVYPRDLLNMNFPNEELYLLTNRFSMSDGTDIIKKIEWALLEASKLHQNYWKRNDRSSWRAPMKLQVSINLQDLLLRAWLFCSLDEAAKASSEALVKGHLPEPWARKEEGILWPTQIDRPINDEEKEWLIKDLTR